MSFDGDFERLAILARARAYLLGGRVHNGVPDDTDLERNEQGLVKPYAVLHWGAIYASPDDRTIMGEEEQPHVMPFSIACYAPSAQAAQASAGAARSLFVGWQPSPGSEEIVVPSGLSFRDRDSTAGPTLSVEVVALETVINVGDNGGFAPSPGTLAPGGAPLSDVTTIVNTAIADHVNDPTPHPAYDDLPSLVLLYENALI